MRAVWASLLALLAACGGDVTEIVVSIDSDLAVGTSLSSIEALVTSPSGAVQTATATVTDRADLPVTLVLVHDGGPTEPVRLSIRGLASGGVQAAVSRVVAFRRGERRRLSVFLPGACRGAACESGRSCDRGGACRDERARDCEYEGEGPCPAPDAGRPDAGVDAGPVTPDAGPPGEDGGTCPLTAVCGARDRVLPGDALHLRPCEDPRVVVRWSLSGPDPDALTDTGADEQRIRLTTPGVYEIAVETSGTCRVWARIEVVPFEPLSSADRPDEVRLGLTARVGAAFVSTEIGPYAVTREGWASVAPTLTGDLETVAAEVRAGSLLFATKAATTTLRRVALHPTLPTGELFDVPLPAPYDARDLAVPLADAGSGADGPVVFGTKQGIVVLSGDPATPTILAALPGWDPQRDVAVGRDAPGRGGIWGIRANRIRNARASADGGGLFARGAEVATTAGDAMAIEIDDRDDAAPRLFLCSADLGLEIFDVGGDLTELSALPEPVARDGTIECRDLAVSDDGDVWVAADLGLLRYDRDGDRVLEPDLAGVPGASIVFVAAAWDATGRQIWSLHQDGDVHVASAAAR